MKTKTSTKDRPEGKAEAQPRKKPRLSLEDKATSERPRKEEDTNAVSEERPASRRRSRTVATEGAVCTNCVRERSSIPITTAAV